MAAERTLVRLAEVEQEQLEWIWEGYLAKRVLSIFCGDPGQGKSRVCYDLSARLTAGLPLPGSSHAVPPQGVVLIQGEDNVSCTVRPGLMAAGADLDRIVVYDPTRFGRSPLRLPADLELVRQAARTVNAGLVVIDPSSLFIDCEGNSERRVRAVLSQICDFAEDENVSVLLVRHLNKSGRKNALHQSSGSIGWIAAARIAFRVQTDPVSRDRYRRLIEVVKTNLTQPDPIAFRTVLLGDHIGVEWLGPAQKPLQELIEVDRHESTKLWQASEVLFLILRDGAKPTSDVNRKAREEGIAPRTLERARALLDVQCRRVQFSPHYWHMVLSLPEEDGPVLTGLREKYPTQTSGCLA